MADNRIPLIVNSTANQIQELPTDDNLLLNDTNKLVLGTQGELEIFHNSSGNSYIKHTPPSGSNLDLRVQIAGQQFVVEKTNGQNFIVADHTVGDVALHFADGTSSTEKLTTIGTGCTVTGDIHASGKIVPSLGSGTGNGIRWPENPGGGSGDAASITYFAESGENTKLRIATGNDADDDIEISTTNAGFTTVTSTLDATSSATGAFRVAGGVGIGKKLFVGTEFKIGSETGSTAVDIVRDEDDMISNDPKALATQQSIKKYVDDSTSASGNALSLTADDGGATTIIFATETLDIEGTANEIVTATGSGIAANKLRVGLTNNVTIGNNLTVTNNLTAAKATVDNIELNASKILIGSGDELDIHYDESSGTSRILHDPPSSGNSDDLRLQITRNQLILEKKVGSGNGHNFITCDYDSNETRICFADNSTGSTKLTTKTDGADLTGILRVSEQINVTKNTQSSDTTSGSIITAGGIGVARNIHVGNNLTINGVLKFDTGEDADIIRDEDTMISNDPNALATQQSIKAYVDNYGSLVKEIKEVSSSGETSLGSNIFTTKLTLNFNNCNSSSRFMVFFHCQISKSAGGAGSTKVFITTNGEWLERGNWKKGGTSFTLDGINGRNGILAHSRQANGSTFSSGSGEFLDIGSVSGTSHTRTIRLQLDVSGGGTAYMKEARMLAVRFDLG